jgi:hypothetical protein
MRHVTPISSPFSARCAYFPSPRGCRVNEPLATRLPPSPEGHSFTPISGGSLVYPDLRGATRHCSFVFITLQIPFPATPLFSHPYKTPGVSPLRHSPSMPSPPLCPLRLYGKLPVFSSLPPLEISLRYFCNSRPLFPITCSLFCKTPGVGGYPDPVFGFSVGVDEDSRCRRRHYGTPGDHLHESAVPTASP